MSSVTDYLEELDIRPSDHSYSYASKILSKYGEDAYKILQLIPVDYRRRNEGWILNSIDEFGPLVVREVLNSGVPVEYVHRAGRIWEDLKPVVNDTSNQVQYTFIFSGHVQGVSFRGTAELYGGACGLVVNAENLPNGTVEVSVQGPEKKINIFLNSLSREFDCTYEVKS